MLLSKTDSPSNGTSAGRFGLEPVAMTMKSPVIEDSTPPSGPHSATVWASTKRAWPTNTSMR